jgi:Ca-activated chloride channel family protein
MSSSRWMLVWALTVATAASFVGAQDEPRQTEALQAEPVALQSDPGGVKTGLPERFGDPFEAYQAGVFDQALEGFLDEQIEHPEDPIAALNVGSAHYEMRNYSEADKAFATGALSAETQVRQKALYNLGNSAYRQGRLQDAVELYKSALELDPEDVDSKFNLEFVRDEIRRRHEEAQKRQDQENQQQQQDQQNESDSQNQDQDQQSPQEENDQNQDDQGSDASQPQPDQSPDSDQDGLPDEIERSGENPTDPENPDSDGDGLPDGAEDLNRNGRVDPQETDPNNPDTDGDGQPDSQDPQGGSASAEDMAETSGTLTQEEAERYLQALEEGRPVREQPGRSGRRRTDKDW